MGKINVRMLALFLFIIMTWGLSWPINKIGLASLSPLWFTTLRLVVGTLTMMFIVLIANKLRRPERRDIPLILTIGLLQISCYLFLTNLGLHYLPAGRASLLAYTTPLWVMPIAILLFQERPSLLKWFGFVFGIVGLMILLNPWEMNWHDHNVLFGTAMLLLASLSWAISMLCARYMKWNKSPFELIPWQLLVGTLPVLIFACIKEPHLLVSWNTPLLLSLAYTGIVVTGISYWIGVIVNKELPTLVVSLGLLTVPIFSLLASALFLHEAITFTTISAVTLILMGLMCVAI